MAARHRLSKLLLRYGIVYSAGAAWSGKHDAWLRGAAFGQLAAATPAATRMTFDAGYEAVQLVRARGDAGNHRLHQRWVTFTERRERPTVANVAVARELAGWCWSPAVLEAT